MEGDDRGHDQRQQQCDVSERQRPLFPAEEQPAPQRIQRQLDHEQREHATLPAPAAFAPVVLLARKQISAST